MAYKTPKIMAILNLTPDSFSDGGKYSSLESIKEALDKMLKCGVDVVDVGAESTRPGAQKVSCEEEIRRLSVVLPYMHDILKHGQIKISLDSRNFKTLNEFIHCIDWVSDVQFGSDTRILDLVREYKKQYCFYFSTSVPVDKSKFLPENTNLVEFFNEWISKQVLKYTQFGIDKEQLVFDPGLGFGLSASQSLEVIKSFNKINALGIKTLIGHSRKSFLSLSGENDASKRDLETNLVTSFLMKKNVDYIRVHNFEETRRVLNLSKALYN